MVVGCLEVTLSIPMAHSLKEKRSVVRRCVDRVRNRFNVAVAEVDGHDVHSRAVIGVAVVSNEGPLVNSIIDKILDHIDQDLLGRAEVIDSRFELVHF